MPHLSLIERTRIIKLFNEYASRTKPNYTNISRKAMDSLTASTRTINRYISQLGWRKVNSKYCQIVNPVNWLKRFINCSMPKLNSDNYEDVIDIDECTVELRNAT